jgi:death-on-curing protein
MQGHLKPDFLTVEDVIQIHGEMVTAFGGESGLRDLGLLESAVAMPMQTFGSEFLHNSLFMMAAAYLFHISQNHPFVDGNKRTAYTASLVFLRVNGIAIDRDTEELHEMVRAVGRGEMDKQAIAKHLEEARLSETEGEAHLEANPPDTESGEQPPVP